MLGLFVRDYLFHPLIKFRPFLVTRQQKLITLDQVSTRVSTVRSSLGWLVAEIAIHLIIVVNGMQIKSIRSQFEDRGQLKLN